VNRVLLCAQATGGFVVRARSLSYDALSRVIAGMLIMPRVAKKKDAAVLRLLVASYQQRFRCSLGARRGVAATWRRRIDNISARRSGVSKPRGNRINSPWKLAGGRLRRSRHLRVLRLASTLLRIVSPFTCLQFYRRPFLTSLRVVPLLISHRVGMPFRDDI